MNNRRSFIVGIKSTKLSTKEKNSGSYSFDTIPFPSPIQRFENLMRLRIKLSSKNGVKEYIFLGILRRSSLLVKNMETPLIHQKIKSILKRKKIITYSYDYNQVIRMFTPTPKFELFRRSVDDLIQLEIAREIDI